MSDDANLALLLIGPAGGTGLDWMPSCVMMVVTVLERSEGSAMLKASAWPSAQVPAARRAASARCAWRVNAASSPSAKIMSSAARSANSRCSGGVPQYLW